MTKPLRLRLKQKWLPYLYGYLGKYLLKLLSATCRVRVEGIEEFLRVAASNPCILMFWHNRLAMIAEIMSRHAPQFNYTVMISKSRDGEILAVLTDSFKIGRTIRVPHDDRSTALRAMVRVLKYGREVLVITPDGPRGPIYQVKKGVAIAARETSARIVPLSWTVDRYWTLNTWDKLILPKPFSNIRVKMGKPIMLSNDEERDLTEDTTILQEALQALE